MDTSLLHSAAAALLTYFHNFTDGGSLALHAASSALFIILDPTRMLYLFGGVCMGLSLGILPGIGGVAGTALLLPFTYSLDAPTAFALLLGDDARRLSDDTARRSWPRTGRVLHGCLDRRLVRCSLDGGRVAYSASDHS